MSESQPSKVFLFDNEDPEMQAAYEKARSTFRYFWREVAWERRRIVPALDVACVKAPFSDGENAAREEGHPSVEQMWLNEIDFDGQLITGTLVNSPNWLKSLKEGDSVRLRRDEITDWMYAIRGDVYGAYTVNLMRSRMGSRERQDHDAAWGLNFGNPAKIRVAQESKPSGGLLKAWFGKPETGIGEHPMSEAMTPSFKSQLASDPSLVHAKDDRGWTLLHQEALAGSAGPVKVLLEAGADPNALTNDGKTPRQLAESLGWENVVALLREREAT